MADFIIIADMGPQYMLTKIVEEGITKEDAVNLAWEMAQEVYQQFEGRCGIQSYEDFREETSDDDEAWEMYEESVSDYVDYYVVEVTDDTPRCPYCGEPLTEKETQEYCFNCDEYLGE